MNVFPTGVSFEEAAAITIAVASGRRLPVEQVALSRAHGRVLGKDVAARIALPPFDNSAMDGYALRHADLAGDGPTALRLIGEQFAGRANGLLVGEGECVRITTGAPLPQGADTVAIKENVSLDGDCVLVPSNSSVGTNVRRAGEDAAAGELVLERGCILTAARVSLAASLGIADPYPEVRTQTDA